MKYKFDISIKYLVYILITFVNLIKSKRFYFKNDNNLPIKYKSLDEFYDYKIIKENNKNNINYSIKDFYGVDYLKNNIYNYFSNYYNLNYQSKFLGHKFDYNYNYDYDYFNNEFYTTSKIKEEFKEELNLTIFYIQRCKYKINIYSYNEILKTDILINKINKHIKKHINNNNTNNNILHITYAFDNKYTFPTLISITSLLENKDNNSYIILYLLIPNEFEETNINIIMSLKCKYKNILIIFINMENEFNNLDYNNELSKPVYYRLKIPLLFKYLNKIIYIDSDTLIYNDLTSLINLNISNNNDTIIFNGFLDKLVNEIDRFNITTKTYINTGVLLINNLEKARKLNLNKKFQDFMILYKNNLTQYDQTVINAVCVNHIGILPPQYGMWNFKNEKHALKFNKNLRTPYNEDEFINAYNNPIIRHFPGNPKPWSNIYHGNFREDWWFYANKTDFYEILIYKYHKH